MGQSHRRDHLLKERLITPLSLGKIGCISWPEDIPDTLRNRIVEPEMVSGMRTRNESESVRYTTNPGHGLHSSDIPRSSADLSGPDTEADTQSISPSLRAVDSNYIGR
jgi:hypothetical protein